MNKILKIDDFFNEQKQQFIVKEVRRRKEGLEKMVFAVIRMKDNEEFRLGTNSTFSKEGLYFYIIHEFHDDCINVTYQKDSDRNCVGPINDL